MIEIKNLTKKFDSNVALNRMNCYISEGTIFGLAGSNGSGKSTLLRTLSGVYEPDEGQVIIDGEPAFDNHKIKERCYYIADYPFFFNDSTVENMGKLLKNIYSTWDQQRFEELCEMFQIERKKKIINMSKGMQRQASLILAFAAKPKYLFYHIHYFFFCDTFFIRFLQGTFQFLPCGNFFSLILTQLI